MFPWAPNPTDEKLQFSKGDLYLGPSTLPRNNKCLLTPWETAAGYEHPGQSHKQSSRHVSLPSRLHNSAPRRHLGSLISQRAHLGVVTHLNSLSHCFYQNPLKNVLSALLSFYFARSSLHHP